nr:subtilisin-like protease SBT5.4 [Ipomoea batatas]
MHAQSYIVYLGEHSHGPDVTSADLRRVTDSHYEFLGSFLGSVDKAKDAMIYSYKRHINGFAALLEEHEAAEITSCVDGYLEHPEVLSLFLDKSRKLHTTHSWEFMNVEKSGGEVPSNSIWNKARFGRDVIIANLDTGVWPESQSFNDNGFGPVPKKWKGLCQNETSPTGVRCNRKLIGAKYFNKGYLSSDEGKNLTPHMHTPRDYEGHGTHTLSTLGGSFVPGASISGAGNGTAKGGSPGARVAAYKICWPTTKDGGCYDSDVMKAIDAAIHDGVDVISMSLGGDPGDYFNDGIAIGAFHAVRKGIAVVCSAGNSGPYPGTVTNVAPWIITVGASTLDREFQSNVKLQNGQCIKGTSMSPALPDQKMYPLINSADAKASNASAQNATLCMAGAIDPKKVKGKILVCQRGISARVEKGHVAATAGAIGMILCNDEASANEIIADAHVLPATQITYNDGLKLYKYLENSTEPQGYITPPKAVLQTKPAPVMAAFSSRGPNKVTPEILKPDVTAPGVNIIAAYSQGTSPTGLPFDHRTFPFNVDSGTSMSCPHVSGIVGLLRILHPHWSPAALRSALITTAGTKDNTGNTIRDADDKTATPFAYGAGHVRPNWAADPGLNVGKPATYVAVLRQPQGISVSVEPKVLDFKKIGEEKRFKVTFEAKEDVEGYVFGELIWSDGRHHVTSPIAVAVSS